MQRARFMNADPPTFSSDQLFLPGHRDSVGADTRANPRTDAAKPWRGRAQHARRDLSLGCRLLGRAPGPLGTADPPGRRVGFSSRAHASIGLRCTAVQRFRAWRWSLNMTGSHRLSGSPNRTGLQHHRCRLPGGGLARTGLTAVAGCALARCPSYHLEGPVLPQRPVRDASIGFASQNDMTDIH